MTTIVLLSGGMDSAICLHWALRSDDVIAVCFDYGQAHAQAELSAAIRISGAAGVPLEVYELPSVFTKAGDVFPFRNAILLSAAAARAAAHGSRTLVIGACAEDAEGFPDCRREFVLAMENALGRSMGETFTIEAPLLTLTKKASLDLATQLGCMDAVRMSWSCYHPVHRGARAPQPCGECSACVKREAALCG